MSARPADPTAQHTPPPARSPSRRHHQPITAPFPLRPDVSLPSPGSRHGPPEQARGLAQACSWAWRGRGLSPAPSPGPAGPFSLSETAPLGHPPFPPAAPRHCPQLQEALRSPQKVAGVWSCPGASPTWAARGQDLRSQVAGAPSRCTQPVSEPRSKGTRRLQRAGPSFAEAWHQLAGLLLLGRAREGGATCPPSGREAQGKALGTRVLRRAQDVLRGVGAGLKPGKVCFERGVPVAKPREGSPGPTCTGMRCACTCVRTHFHTRAHAA